MSNSQAPSPLRSRVPTDSLSELLQTGARSVVTPARAVAFWSAIALPFLQVALLFDGLSTPSETGLFLGLLAVNLLALFVGHPHHRED